MAKKTEEKYIFNQTIAYQLKRNKQDISNWQTAIQSAESVTNPQRLRLLEMYQNILTDSFLTSLVQKRLLALCESQILFFNQDRSVNDDVTTELQKNWFTQMIKAIGESIFYGFTLLEFDFSETVFKVIPRTHVVPTKNIVTYYPFSGEGIDYSLSPYNNFVVLFGGKTDLGLLMQACPLVLYKRGALGDWAQFAELFGMPIREYTYDPLNSQSRVDAEMSAKEAGSAAYIISPEGTSLTLHNGVDGDGKVYDDLRKAMNEELSILILGQSMTTTNGSSRSQAEVHNEQQKMIFKADKNMIENYLNELVLPILQRNGLVPSGYFGYDNKENLDITDIIALSQSYNIPATYFSDKYGIEVSEKSKSLPSNLSMKKKSLTTLKLSKSYINSILDSGNLESLLTSYKDGFLKEVTDNLTVNLSAKNEGKILLGLKENAYEFANARFEFLKNELNKTAKENHASLLKTFDDYFETEKQHFTASSQMARKWLDIEKNAVELPYLKYVVTNDSFVRPNHRALSGVTLPVNHDFWNTHTPPLGFRCRCSLQQLKKADVTPNNEIPKTVADEPMFAQNSGKSGKAFTDLHPYFEGTDKIEIAKKAIEQVRNDTLSTVQNFVGNTYAGIKITSEINKYVVYDNFINLAISELPDLLSVATYVQTINGLQYFEVQNLGIVIAVDSTTNELYSIAKQ